MNDVNLTAARATPGVTINIFPYARQDDYKGVDNKDEAQRLYDTLLKTLPLMTVGYLQELFGVTTDV